MEHNSGYNVYYKTSGGEEKTYRYSYPKKLGKKRRIIISECDIIAYYKAYSEGISIEDFAKSHGVAVSSLTRSIIQYAAEHYQQSISESDSKIDN